METDSGPRFTGESDREGARSDQTVRWHLALVPSKADRVQPDLDSGQELVFKLQPEPRAVGVAAPQERAQQHSVAHSKIQRLSHAAFEPAATRLFAVPLYARASTGREQKPRTSR